MQINGIILSFKFFYDVIDIKLVYKVFKKLTRHFPTVFATKILLRILKLHMLMLIAIIYFIIKNATFLLVFL